MAAHFILALAILSSGGAGPVSLGQYAAAVHRDRLSLDAGRNVTAVRQSLNTLGSVRLPSGTISTDLPQLAGRLHGTDPQAVRAVARQLDVLDRALQHGRIRPADARTLRALDAVLREPVFHPARPPWAFITDRLNALYRQLMHWLDDQTSHNSVSSAVFGLLLVLLVAGVGFLVARGALGRLTREITPAEEPDVPATPGRARDRASEAARRGDFRQALRYLFLSTMLDLQAGGAIELRPGVTNREYLRLIEAEGLSSGARAALAELIDAFDPVWYGKVQFGEQDYRRAEELARLAVEPSAGVAA